MRATKLHTPSLGGGNTGHPRAAGGPCAEHADADQRLQQQTRVQ